MRHTLDETERRIAAALLVSPRATWREIGRCLGLSERTVVRRAGPLYADGTLRATAVRNPALPPGSVAIALRIQCRPNKIRQVADALARRTDTVWVDILGGGDEISAIFFLDSPHIRNTLLLRDLPATDAVRSWTAYTLLRVLPTALHWTAGLLSAAEIDQLALAPVAPGTLIPLDIDAGLIAGLVSDGRIAYADLAQRTGVTAITVRRRLDALVRGQALRFATEIDLALLGVHAEALLWLNVRPSELDAAAEMLAIHPQVRFVAATTGPANLLVAVAAADLNGLYAFLVTTVGSMSGVNTVDTTPLLATTKRTGLIRRSTDPSI